MKILLFITMILVCYNCKQETKKADSRKIKGKPSVIKADNTSTQNGPQTASPKQSITANGSQPSTSNPFHQSGKDLYLMTREQLEQVPPHQLLSEVKNLRTRRENQLDNITNTKTFIINMCRTLNNLKNKCLSMEDLPTTKLNISLNICTNYFQESDQDDSHSKKTTLHTITKITGAAFRLVAEDYSGIVFVSNIIKSKKDAVIFTVLGESNPTRIPRWKDIIDLRIVAVKPTSKIVKASIRGRINVPDDLKLAILVGSKKLLPDFKLYPRDDIQINSEKRINPYGLRELNDKESCGISHTELIKLQNESKVR